MKTAKCREKSRAGNGRGGGAIFHSLKDKRNQMIQENRATDAVDDVLLKVIHAMEPSGKEKRRQKHHEER